MGDLVLVKRKLGGSIWGGGMFNNSIENSIIRITPATKGGFLWLKANSFIVSRYQTCLSYEVFFQNSLS